MYLFFLFFGQTPKEAYAILASPFEEGCRMPSYDDRRAVVAHIEDHHSNINGHWFMRLLYFRLVMRFTILFYSVFP